MVGRGPCLPAQQWPWERVVLAGGRGLAGDFSIAWVRVCWNWFLWHLFPSLCPVQSLDTGHGGGVYTIEIGQYYTSGLFLPRSWLLHI